MYAIDHEISHRLTRREQFAMAAMAALIVARASSNVCAENAVWYADALIAELDKGK